jgi:putative hemolysin
MKSKIYDENLLNEEIIIKILNFRKSVFDETYDRTKKDEWSLYDSKSIHFLVLDNEDDIIGYYRTRLFGKNNIFESQSSELFDLSYYKDITPLSLELSRACVHPNYRDGSVISLLWTKISEFLLSNDIKFSFGSTSTKDLKSDDFYWIIYNGNILTYPVMPKEIDYNSIIRFKLEEDEIKKKNVTTLIRAYGKQGALFCPYPAFDKEWKTYDYFTVFETNNLVKKFRKMN